MKYPLEPLQRLSGVSKSEMQRTLRVGGRDWATYWRDGVTARVADRFAGQLGFHPAEVWPSWFDDALDELAAVCPECSSPFLPRRKGHTYCTTGCKHRAGDRRRWPERGRRPEVREYQARYRAFYKAKYRDALNAEKRAKYHAAKAAS